MTRWIINLKIAVAAIRRLRATAKELKWSRKLMEAQIDIVDALPKDHPRRARELQQLQEFVDLSTAVRGIVPKRSGGAS